MLEGNGKNKVDREGTNENVLGRSGNIEPD